MNTNSETIKRVAALVIGGAIVAGGVVAGVRPGSEDKAKTPAKTESLKLKVDESSLKRSDRLTASFGTVVRKVTPAVVQVTVSKKASNVAFGPGEMPPGMDLFERFFNGERSNNRRSPGMKPLPQPRQHGAGSGVIVAEDGYILTNNHVVEGADDVTVKLDDGREFKAKVKGRDPKTDIAVLKIEAKELPSLEIADSDAVEVGDVVLAIGNPFDIGQTVTMGIVSAKGRGNLGLDYEDFIQTDAAINPGNSGGALVDSEGRLIGINTAILSRTGANNGIGFAVPMSIAKNVMEDLVKDGHVTRGFLGVSIQDVTPAIAKKFDLKDEKGALVADVSKDSPAEKAGLKDGDVIVEYNDKAVRDSRSLRLMVAKTPPGTKIPVKVLRDGDEKSLNVTLKALPESKELAGKDSSDTKSEALQGVAVSSIDEKARKNFELPKDLQGAVVTEVAPDSAAHTAGLQPGDVITEINRKTVKDAEDAVRLTESPKDKVTLLRVWREGHSRYVVVDETEVG
jgi:serine protease Do